MKNILLFTILATCTLYTAGCSKKDDPSTQDANSPSQLLQSTWQLMSTEITDTPTSGAVTTSFKSNEGVVWSWTATTAQEYIYGTPQTPLAYTLSGTTLTTTTPQGVTTTGQILTITRDELTISQTKQMTSTGLPGTSIVVYQYVKFK